MSIESYQDRDQDTTEFGILALTRKISFKIFIKGKQEETKEGKEVCWVFS